MPLEARGTSLGNRQQAPRHGRRQVGQIRIGWWGAIRPSRSYPYHSRHFAAVIRACLVTRSLVSAVLFICLGPLAEKVLARPGQVR
jgi:hypothetical protein